MGYLRTNGVGAGIDNQMSVAAVSGGVSVDTGICFIGGCALEITDTPEIVSVPTSDGVYSVAVKTEMGNNVVMSISVGCYQGQITNADDTVVLALVTVDGGVISNISDVRTWSLFRGNPQIFAVVPEWQPGDNVIHIDAGYVNTTDHTPPTI
ncbi:hypothetical protein FACS189492_2880 [Clostridia bacterium]|nr:hypothetical protein FACS189492_2880 [Clostridia bacterium]